jgi:hypothetical protein
MPRAKKVKDQPASANGPDMDFIGSTEEGVLRSIASRQKLRSQVDDEVEAFLKKGGAINEIESNVMADPPRKPTSNYGSRPI